MGEGCTAHVRVTVVPTSIVALAPSLRRRDYGVPLQHLLDHFSNVPVRLPKPTSLVTLAFPTTYTVIYV